MTDRRKLPPGPRTIAEMIPVRRAEIAARPAPVCSMRPGHGPMPARDPAGQAYETIYVGVWYECKVAGCGGNSHYLSRELAAYHGEPYVVDENHWEKWDGEAWVPVTRKAALAFWRARGAVPQRVKAG